MSGIPDTADPALEATGYQYTACLELVGYADRDVRHGGLRLVPQAAVALPQISRDGRTYVFTIRRGLRFYPSRKPLTAADFAWVLYRDLKSGFSPGGAALLADVVGADAAVTGGPPAGLRGVRAVGRKLVVRLTRPVPDFLARLASPYFCALPRGTPSPPFGIEPPIPSAGPYYVASFQVGSEIVLRRNPLYRGPRPHRFATIRGRLFDASGTNDVEVVPPKYLEQVMALRDPARTRWARGLRPQLSYVALNWNRPLFRDHPRLARAVAYALDRTALVRAHSPAGLVTDHMLPTPLLGTPFYPLRQDLARARALATGQIGDGQISVATCDASDEAAGDVVVANLKELGFRPTMTHYNCALAIGFPIDKDVLLTTFVPRLWTESGSELYDAAPYLRELVETNPFNHGGGPKTNFAVSAWTKRLTSLEQIRPLAARDRAAARLDRALMRALPPLVPYMLREDRVLLSNRVGCFTYQPVFGPDLGAFCPR